ncbi:MAG: squalene/phytoene synthase family protein [Elusimicrobiota bacterium]
MKKYKISKDNRLLLQKTARTLYLSFSILPAYVKYMLSSGYLVARAMDSVVDCEDIPVEEKEKFLIAFKKHCEGNFSQKIHSLKPQYLSKLEKWERKLVENIDEIAREFWLNMDEEDKKNFIFLIDGIFKGMMMDIKNFNITDRISSFKSFKDLIRYAGLIGGTPAVYWHNIYKKYMPDVYKNNVLRSSYRIGMALQLTNILKDIYVDLRKGRCYIPQEFLNSAGFSEVDLLDYKNIDRIKPFINSIILTCVDYFDESEFFIDSIKASEFALKISLIWPIYWAMDSLYLVAAKNPLKSRIKIGRLKIYKTLVKSPLLLNPTFFHQGYRFRRETLILEIR